MSHNFSKVAGATLVAIVIAIFAASHYINANHLPAAPVPEGTYWNLDAGFGDSELRFLDGSRYTNGGIGAVSVEGNYTLTQDQITFIEYGPEDAPCLHIPGIYRWRLNRKVLALKEMDDKCPTRQFDWASGLWINQTDTPLAQ